MSQVLPSFWSLPAEQVLDQLKSGSQGLSRQEARQRLSEYGANKLRIGRLGTTDEQGLKERSLRGECLWAAAFSLYEFSQNSSATYSDHCGDKCGADGGMVTRSTSCQNPNFSVCFISPTPPLIVQFANNIRCYPNPDDMFREEFRLYTPTFS